MKSTKANTLKQMTHETLGKAINSVTARRIGAVTLLAGGTLCLLGQLSQTEAEIGPTTTTVSLGPSLHGETAADTGPGGTISLNTHDGFLKIHADVGAVDVTEVKTIIDEFQTDQSSLENLPQEIQTQIKEAERHLALETGAKLLLFGVGATGTLMLIERKKLTKQNIKGAAALSAVPLLTVGLLAGTAIATQNEDALATAKFTGPLQNAAQVLDGIQTLPTDYNTYSQQTAKLLSNILKLYETGENLPILRENVIKVLVISDVHCNVGAFDSVKQAADVFEVDGIIDAGDITDYGTVNERFCYDPVKNLGMPYVYAKGNHDSLQTVEDLRAMPNVQIAEDGKIITMAGLQIAGVGDPRYEADYSSDDNDPRVEQGGETLLNVALQNPGLDIALKHDPSGTEVLTGAVPLVISGHMHTRAAETNGNTIFYTEGSTGGAGLRAYENAEGVDDSPTPQTASVFYFDTITQKPIAVDQITFGGPGTSSVSVKRCIIDEQAELSCS